MHSSSAVFQVRTVPNSSEQKYVHFCLESHSDGTHSLQRIKSCNVTFLKVCSNEETKLIYMVNFWVKLILKQWDPLVNVA